MAKSDSQSRLEALDTTQSFIVEAPAGSGKTELLVSRFLALIATRQVKPEQVYAITFTKKAQFEMKHRIESILKQAEAKETPKPHQQTSYSLAKTVLDLDEKHQWKLLDQIDALNIMTIDALTQGLLDTSLPSQPRLDLCVYPDVIYRRVVEQAMSAHQLPDSLSSAFKRLLQLTQNNLDHLTELSCLLLRERETWLPYLSELKRHSVQDQSIKQALCQWTHSQLERFYQAIGPSLYDAFCRYYLTAMPDQVISPSLNLNHWQDLLALLLTRSKSLRKRINHAWINDREQAIDIAALKSLHQSLVDQIDTAGLLDDLLYIRELPRDQILSEQTDLIRAFSVWLPYIAAHLNIYFDQNKIADYTHFSLTLQGLLSDDDNALAHHYRINQQIHHLLVDEFQDTSINQYQLLISLTQHWDQAVNTLFLVGDPMQSIYRFRKAEVELFSQIQDHGLGSIHLNQIRLSTNYRSSPVVVDSINQLFHLIGQSNTAKLSQPVIYQSSVSGQSSIRAGDGVYAHWLDDADSDHELIHITQLIERLSMQCADESIAILVRSRSQIKPLCRYLMKQGIEFVGDELIPINQSQWLHDLLAATLLLFDQDDQLIWFQILKSPIITLPDAPLSSLQWTDDLSAWYTQLDDLSKTHEPLATFLDVLRQTRQHLPLGGIRPIINDFWRQLGFYHPKNHNQVNMSLTVLDIIETILMTDTAVSKTLLMTLIDNKFIDHKPSAISQVHILTIHKSKGLEFDHVILPCLHKRVRPLDKKPLYIDTMKGAQRLTVIAPKDSQENPNQWYQFMHYQNQIKDQHERIRLFYVACTRAKCQLHFTATLTEKPVIKDPILSALTTQYPARTPSPETLEIEDAPTLTRYQMQPCASHIRVCSANTSAAKPINTAQQLTGSVCHLLIEKTSGSIDELNRIKSHAVIVCDALIPEFNRREHVPIVNTCHEIVSKWYGIDWVSWLFSHPIANKHHEIELHHQLGPRIQTLRIDYLIEFPEMYWVVDFKTMSHPSHSTFSAIQSQLDQYASLIQHRSNKPVYCCVCPLLSSNCLIWFHASDSPCVTINCLSELKRFVESCHHQITRPV